MTVKILAIISLTVFLMGSAPPAGDYEYIGAAKCKMCHNSAKSGFQYKIWAAGPHANAMKSLSSPESIAYGKANGIANPATSPKCTRCHSTYASVSEDIILSLTDKEGVSCESCHGPGSVYKSMSIMKNREKALASGMIMADQKVCEKCHNKDNPFFKPFDYKKASAKIAHPTPAAE